MSALVRSLAVFAGLLAITSGDLAILRGVTGHPAGAVVLAVCAVLAGVTSWLGFAIRT